MDGVRITVVDAESGQPVSSSFDLTNKTPSIKIHFGKVSENSICKWGKYFSYHGELRLLHPRNPYAEDRQQWQPECQH